MRSPEIRKMFSTATLYVWQSLCWPIPALYSQLLFQQHYYTQSEPPEILKHLVKLWKKHRLIFVTAADFKQSTLTHLKEFQGPKLQKKIEQNDFSVSLAIQL